MAECEMSPLEYTLLGGVDLVRLPINHGANAAVQADDGTTPLIWASSVGCGDVQILPADDPRSFRKYNIERHHFYFT